MLAIIIILLLIGVVYYDFRYRLIPVWLFFALGFAIVLQGILMLPIKIYITYFLVNLFLLALLIGGVFTWYWFRHRRFTNIIDSNLGSGDLAFMAVTAMCFGPFVFITFQVVSIFLVLVFFGFYIAMFKRGNYLIPLAGGQAILFIGIQFTVFFYNFGIQYRDDLIMHYLLFFAC